MKRAMVELVSTMMFSLLPISCCAWFTSTLAEKKPNPVLTPVELDSDLEYAVLERITFVTSLLREDPVTLTASGTA